MRNHYPQSLVNWSVDQFGNAHWMLFRETTDGNEDWTTFDKQATEVVKYVLWTRMDWTVFDSDFTPIDTGVHGLKRVPVDAIFDKKSKKYRNLLGVSDISDISFIARDVYNKCSELNEILRNQTFAFLTVQGKASDFNELSIGTSKAMLYPEGMNQPAYISPPADNARVIMDQIDKQITKIFQLAKLTGTSGQETGTLEQSGVSKAYDFHETNSALSQKAAHMEDGELRMWQTWATWEGKEFDGNVQYSRDFNVKDLMSDLTEAEKLMRLQMGQMFDAEVKKGIIKKKFQ